MQSKYSRNSLYIGGGAVVDKLVAIIQTYQNDTTMRQNLNFKTL